MLNRLAGLHPDMKTLLHYVVIYELRVTRLQSFVLEEDSWSVTENTDTPVLQIS